ncbi:MAG: MBL fold metallo-hydrolase [Spirosomataceae bacterium]
MKIQFYGAARTVTGSKHLITTDKGVRILLDCGMFQGIGTTEMNQRFGFEPASVDYLVLSHAHIDHCGLIPRLVAKGFRGPIYCTDATKDLCRYLLSDSAHIQETDLKRVNERRENRGEKPLESLYTQDDVETAMGLFTTVDYHQTVFLNPEISVCFYDAGHLLGSASVFLTIKEGDDAKKLWFTGDIGRPDDRILRCPEPVPQADYIITESTYGDRLHETEPDMKSHLLRIVQKTCVENKGKLIIPAFAVDRTQELIFALDQLESEDRLPPIKVFIDSPLAINATRVMRDHEECFNPDILQYIKKDGDAFDFPTLKYVSDVAQSKGINSLKEPCVIISASGMAEAGRIKHHIRNNVEDPRNTILIVGYCSPDSLGGALKRGDKEVRIFGETFAVRAHVEIMDSFSAHADYKEMIKHLSTQDPTQIKELFLVHGDYDTQLAFKGHLEGAGFQNIYIPEMLESVTLS